MKILVTGGAGYIGSHTCVELLNGGHEVIVVDNLCNSSKTSLERVKKITQCNEQQIKFYNNDVRDRASLKNIFKNNNIDAVFHFAGLKSVGDSNEIPLEYYNNNVAGTIVLIEEMERAKVGVIIFSSSATIYGDPASVPIKEDARVSAMNPYGRSKLMVEEILQDLYRAKSDWKIGLLRYFNPVGAHKSGELGEFPLGIPNNIMPFISQVAAGKLNKLNVFGGDYPMYDGTGVRDYIHVVDLAKGHISALNALFDENNTFKNGGILTVNLGTGRGYSVLELIKSFEDVSGKKITYEIVERRAGDIAECYADTRYAEQEIGWKSKLNLQQMCEDTWRWQMKNMDGYLN
jgi:UDP-glucose 4-epimerase